MPPRKAPEPVSLMTFKTTVDANWAKVRLTDMDPDDKTHIEGMLAWSKEVAIAAQKTKTTDPLWIEFFKDATFKEDITDAFEAIERFDEWVKQITDGDPALGSLKFVKALSGADEGAAATTRHENNQIDMYKLFYEDVKAKPAKVANTEANIKAFLGSQEKKFFHELVHYVTNGQIPSAFKAAEELGVEEVEGEECTLDTDLGWFLKTEEEGGMMARTYKFAAGEEGTWAFQEEQLGQVGEDEAFTVEDQQPQGYDYYLCKALASLENGSVAAALNCDNYACFAVCAWWEAKSGSKVLDLLEEVSAAE